MSSRPICAVESCDRESRTRSFCQKHYVRFLKYGDPLVVKKLHSYGDVLCSRDGCGERARWAGWCGKHAMRVKRYGNPDHLTTEDERRLLSRIAQPKLGKLKTTTYPKFLGRHLHRQVAEQKLGRPLRSNEIVHHIDENKHNNNPDNLEVLIDQSHHIRRHSRSSNGKLRRAC